MGEAGVREAGGGVTAGECAVGANETDFHAAEDVAVARGHHVVRIEARGYAPLTRAIELADARASIRFDAPRTPASLDALAGPPDAPLGDAARAELDSLRWSARLLDARRDGTKVVYRIRHAESPEFVERTLDASRSPDEVADEVGNRDGRGRLGGQPGAGARWLEDGADQSGGDRPRLGIPVQADLLLAGNRLPLGEYVR